MTDLIPAGVRGRYFGTRSGLMNAAAMVIGFGGASLVDQSKPRGLENWTYAWLLILAVVCGAIGTFSLSQQPEPEMEHKAERGLRELVMMPFRHHAFRTFSGTFMVWQIGLGVAAP